MARVLVDTVTAASRPLGEFKLTRLLLGLPLFAAAAALGLAPDSAVAQEPTAADAIFMVNNVWMLVSTFMVFIMDLGFATIGSGLTQSKNTVNILSRRLADSRPLAGPLWG